MSEVRNLTGSVTSNDQECRAMGSPLLENGEKGGSRDGGGEQGKEQKGKLPCQAYLSHHPVSDRSWLVECASDYATHCGVLFVLFCFTLKKKKSIATI